MHTKLIGLCASLVALAAFAIVPALSSAHVANDTVAGVVTKVAVGSKIVGYSEETSVLESPGLRVECNENKLTGTVTRDEPGKGFQGNIEDAWFQSNLTTSDTDCNTNFFSLPARITLNATNGTLGTLTDYCIETIQGTDKFKLEPHKCGGNKGAFTFQVDVTGGPECGFTRTTNIEGTFTTGAHGVPATFTANGVGFTTSAHPGHSGLCPASGTLNNLKFKIYTDTCETSGDYSSLCTKDTEDPVWITTE
jgi:hypothetical protein